MLISVVDKQRSAPAEDLSAGARPPWFSRGRVPCLDGLRGTSIMFVLLAHCAKSNGFSAPHLVQTIARHGSIGVDVFFCLSGFLITLLLLRESERTGTVSLRGFYLRRVLRIVPAYVAFLLVVFGLTQLGYTHLSRRAWLGALTYTENFNAGGWELGHVWSLSVEEQFYLLWPPLLFLLRPKRARFAILSYLLAAPVARMLIWTFLPRLLVTGTDWGLERVDCIAAGCALAFLTGEPLFNARTRRLGAKGWLLGALALSLLVASLAVGDAHRYTYAMGYSVRAVGIATFVWVCAYQSQSLVGQILSSRLLVGLGTLSYSIYLWQQLFLNPYNAAWSGRWPLNLALAVLAGIASHLLIEAPFLRMKDRYSRREAKRTAAAAINHDEAARATALMQRGSLEVTAAP